MPKRNTVLVAAVAVLVVGGVSGAVVQRARAPQAPVPAASAPVAAVAAAYLAAAENQDCGLTRALTAPDATWSWCADPRLLSYRDVGRPYDSGEESTAVPEKCVDFTMTTTGSSDGSIPAGDEPWSLCFVQTGDGWRLYDQGQG